ncbi:MAG: twin-arginine translocase subunit TatC, partial [Candidatus Woesearchaeota archaeon]
VFQIPVVMIILKSLNLADVAWLSGKRKHVYVAVFILAAVLTPGVDVFTQVVLAVPMIVLYEIGVLLIRLF